MRRTDLNTTRSSRACSLTNNEKTILSRLPNLTPFQIPDVLSNDLVDYSKSSNLYKCILQAFYHNIINLLYFKKTINYNELTLFIQTHSFPEIFLNDCLKWDR